MGKVTLRDIALSCNVSATVVSAVLNKRNGRISCSEVKRREIEAVARELDYKPNLLARSMVKRRTPIVAVMLRDSSVGYNDGDYSYFVRHFPLLTRLLNARGLEVIFSPYHDENEQIEKLEYLSANGFAGGFITNVCPLHYKNIAPRLIASQMPYVMLGYPKDTDACCVYYRSDRRWVEEYARKRGVENVSLITSIDGKLHIFDYPFPDNYMWLRKPRLMTVDDLRDDGRFYVCSSVALFRGLPEKPANVIIADHVEHRAELPPGIPAMLSDSDALVCRRMGVAADIVSNWMLQNVKPVETKNELQLETPELLNWDI